MKNPKISATRTSQIAILITAAALMLLIAVIQFYDVRREMEKSLERHAEMELFVKSLTLDDTLTSVKTALQNHVWEAEQLLPFPDSLFSLTQRIVEYNSAIVGCSMAMIPDYYPEKGRLFEPYTVRRDSTLITTQLASEDHDYSQRDLFLNTVNNDQSYWSEPYPDPENPAITLITYTCPIHDETERAVAAIAVDISAAQLSYALNRRHMFPSSYNLLLSGEGKLICGPVSKNRHKDVEQIMTLINDSTVKRTTSVSGRITQLSFIDWEDHSEGTVYYFTPKTMDRWHIAVVNYDDEVFEPLLKLQLRIMLLMLAGLLVMAFILHRSASNINKLQKAEVESEHLNSELNVARSIQMEMLPKTYPPFPERDDIDIYGMLEPAKMVGGDLFDFFIRDEKLYFCIGDVSGKGVPAALIMSSGITLFRSASGHDSDPARIMSTLNEAACRNNEHNMFLTMFIGVLDLPTGRLRYCNAGHDAPWVIGQSLKRFPVNANLPLGVMDNYRYMTQETTLMPNETLFLYTDGLTEAMNAKHKLFGLERTTATLTNCVSLSTEQIINKVNETVKAFVDTAEQSDDLTMLAVQYTRREKELILQQSITLKNDVRQIGQLNEFTRSATQALQLNHEMAHQIKLAVEEAVVNIMEYAYPANTEGTVEIKAEADASQLRFILIDSGAEFDPTEASKADTTLSLDERPIGGLGIFLVRNMLDSINYERKEGKNILTLIKNINHENNR